MIQQGRPAPGTQDVKGAFKDFAVHVLPTATHCSIPIGRLQLPAHAVQCRRSCRACELITIQAWERLFLQLCMLKRFSIEHCAS